MVDSSTSANLAIKTLEPAVAPEQASRALQFNAGSAHAALPAAIAVYELAEVLESPAATKVPFAPPYCHELLVWQGHSVPVFDLHQLVNGTALETVGRHVLIAAFQTAPGAPLSYIGIRITGLPMSVAVRDADSVALPPGDWARVAVSCYTDGLDAVPILSIGALASLD
jgi:chemotaxis signal transduction protein